MFLNLSLSHSVHGGVPGQVPLGRYTPQQVHSPAGTPSWAGTSPGQVHPSGRYTHPRAVTLPPSNACWDTVNKQAVHILLECILFYKKIFFFLHSVK